MTTIGRKLGAGAFPDVGIGYPVDPDTVAEIDPKSIVYASFSGGINNANSPEDIPENCTPQAQDMEVTPSDNLIAAPGLSLVQDCDPRSLAYTFVQGSLDFTNELITIDPPYLGVKGAGTMLFTNAAIGATGTLGWFAATYGNKLIFSNGDALTYTRVVGATVVTDISADIVARAFGVAFGRLFAGYVTQGSGSQALGLAWNGTSADADDWTGPGAGAELLISNYQEADKIVAIGAIGYDFLGIMCRHSLWVGYPTGVDNRPADPRLRVEGVGLVSGAAWTATPGGLSILTDDGMQNFNSNGVEMISRAINGALLPVDYSQLDRYKCTYVTQLQRLYLQTPLCIWVYEFPRAPTDSAVPGTPGRWFLRQTIIDNVLTYNQADGLTWDAVLGTWDQQTRTWEEMLLVGSNAAATLWVTKDSRLAIEAGRFYFDDQVQPEWRTGFAEKVAVTDQVTTLGFEIEYSSYENADIELLIPGDSGTFGHLIGCQLPDTAGSTRRGVVWCTGTGMGAAVEIHMIHQTRCQISRIRQRVIPAGQVNDSLVTVSV